MKTIRASGYTRVSTGKQITGESLSTQKQMIEDYAKSKGYKLVNIYTDEGISGGTIADRHGLQQCLNAGQQGEFDVLIILRLSRFGRNAREILENHNLMKEAGIELVSIKEGIDFSTKYGKAMLGMFGIMAELERDITKETSLENRISRGRRGFPVGGKLPIGRKFNKETGQWTLDEHIAKMIRWAASQYLQGGQLNSIVKELETKFNYRMSYDALRRTLKNSCGDKWQIRFKDSETLTYTIPPILDPDTIKRVRERMQFNMTWNRTDVKAKYLLQGYIFCESCKTAMTGQTQRKKPHSYRYYRHSVKEKNCANPFYKIDCDKIEEAVMLAILENVYDKPAFDRAIGDSLPDETLIKKLKDQIVKDQRTLKRVEQDLQKLVDLAMKGTLQPATIKKRETELREAQIKISEDLSQKQKRLNTMPDVEKIKAEADRMRTHLMQKYQGPERLGEMSFDEKRRLLHWLFDGTDTHGNRYGIYINKRGDKVDYFLYGKVTGLRTLKGDDINYQNWDEDEADNNYKTKGAGLRQRFH